MSNLGGWGVSEKKFSRNHKFGTNANAMDQVMGNFWNIDVKRISPTSKIPTRAHSSDAGWDLYSNVSETIVTGERKVINTGICMKIPRSFVNLSTKEVKPFSGAPFNIGNRIQAITAIANPNRFFETLEDLPYPLERINYPDHYEFSSDDFVSEKIDEHQPVVMTEKDAVKCGGFANNNFWMLTTNTKLDDAFFDVLTSKIDYLKKDIAHN